MGHDVFISYSSKDGATANAVCAALEAAGLHCWIAPRDIPLGKEWAEAIVAAIPACRAMVLIFSASSNRSPQVRREIERAVHHGVAVLPFRVESLFPTGGMEYYLSAIHWLDAFPPPPEAYLEGLVAGVSGLLRGGPEREGTGNHVLGISRAALWVSNVPARNLLFTGRRAMLAALHQAFEAAPLQALSGLGGMGKSQTAIEYAHRHRDAYQAQFWVRADSEAALATSFARIAALLELPEAGEADQGRAVAAGRQWLERNGGWLLVFDNADHPELVKDYLPRSETGHVLLTSRSQVLDVLGITRPELLEALPPEEALELLLRRTGREEAVEAERQAAAALAQELGYLPLALEQAGAYVTAKQSRFAAYLTAYRQRRLALLEGARPITGDYPASVATTWALNFAEVEKTPAAGDLLCLSAFLHPDAIPLELLAEGASKLGPHLSALLDRAADDPLLLDELLEPLTRYSLVRRDVVRETYATHRLVQAVLRDGMDPKVQRDWAKRAVRAVAASFPTPHDASGWGRCERLMRQVEAVVALVEQLEIADPEVAALLSRAGHYSWLRSSYDRAEALHQRSLAMREKLLGHECQEVAQSLNNLAVVYLTQVRYQEAEPHLLRALAIREKLLGSEHPETAQSLNNLANLYSHQGRYAEAQALYRRAQAIREKQLGAQHPHLAMTLSDLGYLYLQQGRLSEAEPLLQRALAIWEGTLGPDHYDTAQSILHLATVYARQSRYEEAEAHYHRALSIWEKAYGPEHRYLSWVLNGLAVLYAAQRRHEEADPLFQRALAIASRILGPAHPEVLKSLDDYARLLRETGRDDGAEALESRARAIEEKHARENAERR
jgi:tetratricopeptide (TPR) repeat protein